MKHLIISIFILLSLNLSGQPEVVISERCKEAYQEILALRFDKASRLLELERELNANNSYVPFLENYIDFLSVFISEDESLFEKLEENKSRRIDQIKKLSKDSPWRNYFIGNINLQWAVARLKFKEYFTAAFEINRAYRNLESNNENFPDFLPNQISLGVLHIMIGLVPDKYQWLLNIINMEGDVLTGKNELKKVLANTSNNQTFSYLRNEVLFYQGFVELNIYPDKEELAYLLSELEKVEKENLLLSYLTINILMRTGNNDKVLFKFEQLPDSEDYFPFSYLNYLHAECWLRKLNTQQSATYYNSFLEGFNGQNFIKDAYRKSGWISLLENDSSQYRYLMTKVIDEGQNDVGQDKDAEREAIYGTIPNIELIKARLLFDGGYYQNADSLLMIIDSANLNKQESVELAYRKARTCHESGKIKLAIEYYSKTIEKGKESPRYFAANAALKLGEIYESSSNFQHAIFYYKLCLEMEFDEYEDGIHSKAKAGLKRVSG